MTEDTNEAGRQEHYIHDYEGDHNIQIIRKRTAKSHAAFFLPYLRPGMSLLDCGCGAGTITVGLAQAVASGEVVGLDIEETQIDLARSNAAKLGLSKVSFEVGSVYDLPYSDSRFDAVFSHALLEHLKDPLAALKEMRRVTRTGGIVGARSPDWAGALIAPADEVLDKAFEIYFKYRRHNGGEPFIGRHFRALLRAAGFVKTIGSASYETWATAEATKSLMNVLIGEFAGPKIAKQAIEMGWADQSQMDKASIAVKHWAEHPDAFFAHTWCEAVGWKE